MKRTMILSCSRDGRYCAGFLKGLMSCYASPAFHGFMECNHESDIARARGKLLSMALKAPQVEEAEGFLFIDDDIHFTVEDFNAIVQAGSAGCQVVGGLYAKRRSAGGLVFNGPLGAEHPDLPEIVQVKHVGAGFLWISRDVLQRLIRSVHVVEIAAEKPWWHFFEAGLAIQNGGEVYLSEDYAFCETVRKLGEPVWLHRGLKLGHEGREVFYAAV